MLILLAASAAGFLASPSSPVRSLWCPAQRCAAPQAKLVGRIVPLPEEFRSHLNSGGRQPEPPKLRPVTEVPELTELVVGRLESKRAALTICQLEAAFAAGDAAGPEAADNREDVIPPKGFTGALWRREGSLVVPF